jgi:general secretion pathway protein J
MKRDAEAGFTLIEVMVSLLIFGMIAAAGVAILSFSVRAQGTTGAKLDDMTALTRTMSILSADLAQARDRPARDEAGTVLPAFVGQNVSLRFVRAGWSNLDGAPRASLQKVAYQMQDGTLQRIAYPMVDGAQPLPPAALMTHVRQVALRYRIAGAWSDRWDGATGLPLPDALELRVQRDDGTLFTQMFLVGSGYVPTPEAGDAAG